MKNNDPDLKPNDKLMRTTTRHLLVGKRKEIIFRGHTKRSSVHAHLNREGTGNTAEQQQNASGRDDD